MSTSSRSNTPGKTLLGHQAVAQLYKESFADLDDAVRAITATAARILHVDRAGVWLFVDDIAAIYCIHEHQSGIRQSSFTPNDGSRYLLHFSPTEPYMVKLQEGPFVAFESTDTKGASAEFRSYLENLGPRSVLDVPLRVDGRVVGMLCHGCALGRSWTDEELDLAIRLGDMATLAIETDRHRRTALLGDRFQTLVEHTPDSIALSDRRGRIEYLNPSARRLLGLAPDEPIQRERLSEFMARDGGTYTLQAARAHARKHGTWTGELSLRGRNGNAFDARITITHYRGPSGDIEYTAYTIRNISSHTALKRQLADTRAQYEAVVSQTSDALFQIDGKTGRLHGANNAFCNLLGYSADDIENMTIFDLINDTDEHIRSNIDASLSHGSLFMLQRQYQHRDGYQIDVELAAAATTCEGRPTVNVRARDITALLQRRRDIERLAYYDPVTGLANSNYLREHGEALLAASLEAEAPLINYVVTQVNNWQRLTDTLGYRAAESLLQQVAERLKEMFDDQSILIGRLLTGAEFGLLFKAPEQSAQGLVDDINRAFTAPIKIDGEPVHLVMRSGVAQFPTHAVNFKDLTMRAGIALRQAHLKNKASCIYEPTQSGRLHDEHLLEEDLRQAIDTPQIQLRYQPIMMATGELMGMETLVRWQHPTEGWLPPSHFIALAEESGIIVDLDFCVMTNTVRLASPWLQHRPDILLGFNCSALTLTDPRLIDHLRRTLEESPLPPTQTVFEVTETTLIHDRQTATQALEQISKLGMRIALDDFGTGYSSLAYLKNLPVDTLKIDRTFIRGIGTDVRDEHTIETVISLGHDLGMVVLAEGVETQDQMEWLVSRGIDRLQGFYFGKPQTLDELRHTEQTGGFTKHGPLNQ